MKEPVVLGPDRPVIRRVVMRVQLLDNTLIGVIRYKNVHYQVEQHPLTYTWYVNREVRRVLMR